MRMILARLVWNFDLRLDEKCSNWDTESRGYFLWEKGPMEVFLTPRNTGI
jgi:hypothetical protein